jgi:formylglycine-generating enzyme required for sulfatase activity
VLALSGEAVKAGTREALERLRGAGAEVERAELMRLHRALQALATRSKPRGLFVLAYSSHGLSVDGHDCFLAADTLADQLAYTSLRAAAVRGRVEGAHAKRRLMLVDACRNRLGSGERGVGEAGMAESFAKALARVRGTAVLMSSSVGGVAFEDETAQNGVFTSAVLAGLRGEAVGDKSAVITVGKLAAYADERVRTWVKRYRAHYLASCKGVTKDVDVKVDEMPLALNVGQLAKVEEDQRAVEAHRVRVAAAVQRVWENRGDLLTPQIRMEITERLEAAEVPEELLEEIEALDGGKRMQRALLAFLDEPRRLSPRVEVPAWASASGEDEHGRWAAFVLGGVEQRMRWIPPGRFWMGSPKSEAGRLENEGPRHEVELARGFWLGEVPCTQALWQAVMGSNPSRFRSPDRPVELVSWEDCQRFLERVQSQAPALALRLPTEAEWEYACRAGTTTSTYAGELRILGRCNGPLLDGIAWYGGNSGVGFDLKDGEDSSAWPEKQFPHTQAGTRRARTKRPNAWGLYDMLGNVWEWCQDFSGTYTSDLQRDPGGPPSGSFRVIRGGSWYFVARNVRAAVRNWFAPSFSYDNIGFRLARGQEAAPSQVGAAPKR